MSNIASSSSLKALPTAWAFSKGTVTYSAKLPSRSLLIRQVGPDEPVFFLPAPRHVEAPPGI